MRRSLKRTTLFGLRSRGFRCRLERLEPRSMLAADIVAAAVDMVPNEPAVGGQVEPPAVNVADAWSSELPVCDLPVCGFVDETFTVDPSFIDDSCLMVTDPVIPAFEPVDIRVQFVSSESDSSWAAYYYTVGADGVVQGVSVVASYDEPTIAAFVAEHADDPSVQISDYGDGWWIGGFPLELAPPVPDYGVVSDVDAAAAYAFTDGGATDGWDCGSVAGGWTWDESNGTYIWIDGSGIGGSDWTSTEDGSVQEHSAGWYDLGPVIVDYRSLSVVSETQPGWAYYTYAVGADGGPLGATVWASFDEPTVSAFVAGYAGDDPNVTIMEFGDCWWISGFPLELAPPMPDYGIVYGGDSSAAYWETAGGTADVGQGGDVTGGWTWDESNGTYIWIDGCGIDGRGIDGTGGDGYDSTPVFSDVRVKYVSSETQPGWASYTYTVGADGVVQGVSVFSSYDEPTIAAFVAAHADDPTVQIVDYGDGWWIGGFPLELAPPVPDAVSWCGFGGGDPTAYESTDVGVWDPSGSFDIASDWSWDGSDPVYTWDENSESGGGWTWSSDDSWEIFFTDGPLRAVDGGWTCTLLPYAYARGAGVEDSFGGGFVAYSAAAGVESGIDELSGDVAVAEPVAYSAAAGVESGIDELSGDVAVAEPVAVSPRAAAFADMGAMAAAATAMQAGSADASPVGGRRRR